MHFVRQLIRQCNLKAPSSWKRSPLNEFLVLWLLFKMSSKPPLSSRVVCLCAAELGIKCTIIAKVVFTWYRSNSWVELARTGRAVSTQHQNILCLPKRYCKVRAIVPSDIHIFYPLTLATTKEIDDVEVFEVSTEVVSEIDAMGRVAACCSPVGGVDLQRSHSRQT